MASSRILPLAYVKHTYGSTASPYLRKYNSLSAWRNLTNVNCLSVTTVSSNSTGTTLWVTSNLIFQNCIFGESTISVGGQILTINGVVSTNRLTVSQISGTINSGTAIMCGFVLECYSDAAPYTDGIWLAGTTTSSSYFRVIMAAPGHRGTRISGVRFERHLADGSGAGIFSIDEDYSCIYDIAARCTNMQAGVIVFSLQNSYNKTVGCTAYDSQSKPTDGCVGFEIKKEGQAVINCYAYNIIGGPGGYSGGIRIGHSVSSANSYIYNCTITNCTNGIFFESDYNAYIKNCIIQNNISSNIYIRYTSTGLTITNTIYSGAILNSNGYKLTRFDSVANGKGSNLSTDPYFSFDDDIDGNPRSDNLLWCIGCHEIGETSRIFPSAYVKHTYGTGKTYTLLSTWENLTDINLSSVTTVSSTSSGTTLYVSSNLVFQNCVFGESTIWVGNQFLTVNGIVSTNRLTVSQITGTISSGTAVSCGFVLECYEGTYADEVTLRGATTSPSYFRVITAAPGHRGTRTSGVRFAKLNQTTSGHIVRIEENYSGCNDIAFRREGDVYWQGGMICRDNHNFAVGCTFRIHREGDPQVKAAGFHGKNQMGAGTTTYYVINCFFYSNAGVMIESETTGRHSTGIILNNTFNACSKALKLQSVSGSVSTAYVTNNIFHNCDTDFETSGAGTNTLYEHSNVDSGISLLDDYYHLSPEDTAAKNQGRDLFELSFRPGSTLRYSFYDDIDGDIRPSGSAWDIGCDETQLLEISILTQPVGGTKYTSQGHTFTCIAEGEQPLSYQWFKGTSEIGTDSTSLVLTNLQISDSGSYRCVVSNDYEELASNTVLLEVLAGEFTFISHPQSQSKYVTQSVEFTVEVDPPVGSTPTYQWYFGESQIIGETSTILSLTDLELTDAGEYKCLVSVPGFSEFSDSATLSVSWEPISILTQPMDQSEYITHDARFEVEIDTVETYTPTYQWYVSYNGILWGSISGEIYNALTIYNVNSSDEGQYRCLISSPGSYYVQTNTVTLTVTSINILTHPLTQTKYVSQNVTLEVEVEPFTGITHTYQWYYNDLPITDETNSTLELIDLQLSDNGNYYCRVFYGSEYENSNVAELTVVEESIIIITQPQSILGYEGEPAELSVEISPPETFTETYQWYFRGIILTGETSDTLTIPSIGIENQGNYYCIISSPHEDLSTNVVNIQVVAVYSDLPEDTLYTLSPYSNYASNNINRLNRTNTYGNDCILGNLNSFNIAIGTNPLTLDMSPGKCIIDDVLIETDNTASYASIIRIDLEDLENFVSGLPISTETGYYYVCFYYKYLKTRTTPEARIRILHPSLTGTFSHDNNYLLLKVINVQNVSGQNIPIEAYDYDPTNSSNCRQYKKSYTEFFATLPVFSSDSTGRIILVREPGNTSLYIGGESDWVLLGNISGNSFIHIVDSESNPTSTDDDYDLGTFWINSLTQNIYICVNNSTDNAVWKIWLTETGTYPDLVLMNRDPLTSDNTYSIGTLWINETDDKGFVLINISTSVATWIEFTQEETIIQPNLKKYFLL